MVVKDWVGVLTWLISKEQQLLRSLIVLWVVVWILSRLIARFEGRWLAKEKSDRKVDHGTIITVCRLLRIALIFTALLFSIQLLGYPISGLLAIGGAGTIIAGLAARDMLSNFFGGLMIHLDRPFSEGDWIRSPDKAMEGVVEHIGWRLTCIRTLDRRPLYVPNAVFTTILVENPSRMTHRRINERFKVRHEDGLRLPVILEEIRSMLQAHPGIDHRQSCLVNFVAFTDYGLECEVYAFGLSKHTGHAESVALQEDILFQILAIIRKQGAELASTCTPLPC